VRKIGTDFRLVDRSTGPVFNVVGLGLGST
jgi:hypothetical protein